MKPTGPIPADFQSTAGRLSFAGRDVDDLIAQAGETPLFAC